MAAYQEHFQCITIDNRGAGRSSKPEEDSYSTARMAEDVIGIMDALSISKAHINGVSMGGAIAQHLAADHPDRVRSLILTSTFASVSNSFRRAIETLRDAIDQLDPREQAVIRLRFFEDMKLEEIARITGVNLNTVKSRLYKSLRKLRELTGEEVTT